MDSACGNTNTQQLTTWLKKHFRYIFFLLVCVNPKPLILKFPTGVCQRFGLRSAVKVAIGSKGMLSKVLKSIISECCFQYFSLVIFFFRKKLTSFKWDHCVCNLTPCVSNVVVLSLESKELF